MMNVQQKLCPQCNTATALDTAFCASCGRQYRTKFPASNQTQIFYVPPGAAMPVPAAGSPVLAELEAQYKRQFHWVFICFFCFGITVIGIIFGFVILSRIEDIRMKVAGMGISVSQWETPLRAWARRTLGYYALGFLGIPCAIVLAIWLFLLVTAAAVISTARDMPEPPKSAPTVIYVPRDEPHTTPDPDYDHQNGISYGSNPPVVPGYPGYPGQSTRPAAPAKAAPPSTFSQSGDFPARPAQPTIIDHNAPSGSGNGGFGGGNPMSGSRAGRGGGF